MRIFQNTFVSRLTPINIEENAPIRFYAIRSVETASRFKNSLDEEYLLCRVVCGITAQVNVIVKLAFRNRENSKNNFKSE